MKDLILWASVVVIKISRRRLADNAQLHVQHAYFSFSAYLSVNLWSCCLAPSSSFFKFSRHWWLVRPLILLT